MFLVIQNDRKQLLLELDLEEFILLKKIRRNFPERKENEGCIFPKMMETCLDGSDILHRIAVDQASNLSYSRMNFTVSAS